MQVCMSAEAISDAQSCGCLPCKEARELKEAVGQVGIGELQIDHYESVGFPAGSIACLKNGCYLVTKPVYEEIWAGFIHNKNATVRPQEASTVAMSLCPFCKGLPRVESTPIYPMVSDDAETEKQYYVVCNSCAAQGPWVKNSAGAIRLWNMRTPS